MREKGLCYLRRRSSRSNLRLGSTTGRVRVMGSQMTKKRNYSRRNTSSMSKNCEIWTAEQMAGDRFRIRQMLTISARLLALSD